MTVWAFDIETDVRATPHVDGTPAGLDPRVSAVTSIAIVGSDGSARVDTNLDPEYEGGLLYGFWSWILRVQYGDTICTWNGGAFDWPYLLQRSLRKGIGPVRLGLLPTHRRPKYDLLPGETAVMGVRFSEADLITFPGAEITPRRHVDVAYAYQNWCADNDIPWSLKPCAEAWGHPALAAGTGADTGDMSAAELAAYNVSDAHLTLRLALAAGDLLLESFADHHAMEGSP